MASDDRGDCKLTDTDVALTSVAYICPGITSVETDHVAGTERCDGGKILLARDRRLLEIFGWGPCQFRIFGSVFSSVEEIDAPD